MQTESDRLVPPKEGMQIVGVKSASTFYKMIREKELPPLIKRGRSSFHLASELQAYLAKMANTARAS